MSYEPREYIYLANQEIYFNNLYSLNSLQSLLLLNKIRCLYLSSQSSLFLTNESNNLLPSLNLDFLNKDILDFSQDTITFEDSLANKSTNEPEINYVSKKFFVNAILEQII
ncbi:24131_t:CDS:2 [Gigaspora rosea]|nr:24131_t:CDS:2 [Gigaspora rosea]